jgi:hypothetical protein
MAKRMADEERRALREHQMNVCPVVRLLVQRRTYFGQDRGNARERWMASGNPHVMIAAADAIARVDRSSDLHNAVVGARKLIKKVECRGHGTEAWFAYQMAQADLVRPLWPLIAAATLRYYLTHPHRVSRYLHNGLAKLAEELLDPRLQIALDALLSGEAEHVPALLAA